MKIKDLEGWLISQQKKLGSIQDRKELILLKLEELKADEERLKKTINMLAKTIAKLKNNVI